MGSPAEEVDPATKVEDQGEDDAKKNSNEKKHDSGAADLERVTDYAEEKEIVSTSTLFTDAIANIREEILALNRRHSGTEPCSRLRLFWDSFF